MTKEMSGALIFQTIAPCSQPSHMQLCRVTGKRRVDTQGLCPMKIEDCPVGYLHVPHKSARESHVTSHDPWRLFCVESFDIT